LCFLDWGGIGQAIELARHKVPHVVVVGREEEQASTVSYELQVFPPILDSYPRGTGVSTWLSEGRSSGVYRVVYRKQRENKPAAPHVCLQAGRDHDFASLVASPSGAECVPLLSSAPLYTIYTSGTTGDPKVTHANYRSWHALDGLYI